MNTLSEILRKETRQIHTELENHEFSRRLFHAELEPGEYHRYLRGLLDLYQNLEEAIERNLSQPEWAGFPLVELRRAPSLRADLRHFEHLQASPPIPPVEIIDAIGEKADNKHAHLLGIAYVRYMGDLGGGQFLANQLANGWRKNSPELIPALSFYHFDQPVAGLRTQVREILDRLPSPPDFQREIVLWVNQIFRMHSQWFDRLLAGAN